MLSLLLLFVFSIVSAENYAVIYGSVESYTDIELPSSTCRFYDYLITLGYKKENIVYMVDTTDYLMDYNKFYTPWFSEENFYIRDSLFQSTYVSPEFLLHYLIQDEKWIKSASGKTNVRMLHTTSGDNIVVYFTDSHGRSSQFHPDRILSPDVTKKAMLIMKKHKLFKSLMWFVEASYGDYAFHKIDRMSNVIVMTLKSPKEGGVFTYIIKDPVTKKNRYIESVWDGTWPSILPLACGYNLEYLYQLSLTAVLQMADQLLSPGVWGDKNMMKSSLNEFVVPKDSCREFYIYKEGNISAGDEEDDNKAIRSLLEESYGKNLYTTLPMESTRRAFQNYTLFMEGILREVFLTRVEEEEGLTLTSEGCQDFLHFNIQHQCHYFMPIADPLINWLKKLCDNRKNNGMIIVDFSSYCSKNVPSKNMW